MSTVPVQVLDICYKKSYTITRVDILKVERKKIMLKELLKEELQKRNMSVRDAGREIGVSHTTIARILAGIPADVTTLRKVCDFLGVQVSSVLNVEDKSPLGLASKIALVVEREPKLAKVFSDAMEAVNSGNLTTDDLADIVGYAAYKINLTRKDNEGN